MKKITESGVDFAYLGIEDVDELEKAIRQDNVESLNAQLDAIRDLKPDMRMAMWAQYRPDRVTVDDIYAYVRNTRKGIITTLTLAAKKAGSNGALTLDMVNAGNLAAHLLGLEHRTPTEPEVKPRPTTAG